VLVPLAPFETALLAVPEAHPALFQEHLICIHFEFVEPPTVESSADAPPVLWLVFFSSHIATVVHVSPPVLFSFYLACTVHLSPSVLSSFHLAGIVPLFFDDLLVSVFVLFSFHLLFVVHSTAPFYAHDLLFLWPVQLAVPFSAHVPWHLQLQLFCFHSFYAWCSIQQFSVCVPHDFCSQQTSPELAQIEALDLGRMAPMPLFSAGTTHVLQTYPYEAEVEAPQQ